jgi:hypothetical protein
MRNRRIGLRAALSAQLDTNGLAAEAVRTPALWASSASAAFSFSAVGFDYEAEDEEENDSSCSSCR